MPYQPRYEPPFEWECPYCRRLTTISSSYKQGEYRFDIGDDFQRVLIVQAIRCPNGKCSRDVIEVDLHNARGQHTEELIVHSRLVPRSSSKVFPDYVPPPITADYEEACLIKDLSPKASATLARRSLQGMIRDFWGIAKGRLKDEVDALETVDGVDTTTWAAIDAVRQVGNIGAHMEKDIDVIIDVDAGEAELLIGLIEMLVDEWYVARYDRQRRKDAVVRLAEAKRTQQRGQ